MIFVPLDSIYCKIMALIGLQVLSRVCLRAKMNLTFFSTHKEKMILELVEIEAHTSGETIKELLFFIFNKSLILIDDKLKLNNFFSFQFVLH